MKYEKKMGLNPFSHGEGGDFTPTQFYNKQEVEIWHVSLFQPNLMKYEKKLRLHPISHGGKGDDFTPIQFYTTQEVEIWYVSLFQPN